MKRKFVIALLTVAMITATACGAKEQMSETPSPTEPVAEETAEPEAEPSEVSIETTQPIEEDEGDEESVSGNDTGDVEVGTSTIGELNLEEFEADEAKDHKFGDIGYVAQNRDFRSTTGLNSESTEDVWEWLTEDGLLNQDKAGDLWEYGVTGYTGRWAYPTLLESEATEDLYLYDWTDVYASYIADEGEDNYAVLFMTGYDMFNTYIDPDSESEFTFVKFKTLNVNGEDIEVYSVENIENSITYMYKLGGFTVVVEFADDENFKSEDLLLEVMNDIVL